VRISQEMAQSCRFLLNPCRGKHILSSYWNTRHWVSKKKMVKIKECKDIPVTGCATLRLPHFLDNRLTDGGEVVSLTLRPPFNPRKIPGTHFYWRLSRPQGHSAAGRIRSIEQFDYLVGNRTRDLPPCSIVPQPPVTQPRILHNNSFSLGTGHKSILEWTEEEEGLGRVRIYHLSQACCMLTPSNNTITPIASAEQYKF
jgi:hypothetical protein